MKTITDNFEVLWNTHSNDIKMKFTVPVERDKRWWEFWKKSPSKTAKKDIIKLMDSYKENTSIPEDIYIPENKSK